MHSEHTLLFKVQIVRRWTVRLVPKAFVFTRTTVLDFYNHVRSNILIRFVHQVTKPNYCLFHNNPMIFSRRSAAVDIYSKGFQRNFTVWQRNTCVFHSHFIDICRMAALSMESSVQEYLRFASAPFTSIKKEDESAFKAFCELRVSPRTNALLPFILLPRLMCML